MHHKRGKPKQARAGCLMCKRNKFGHGMENELRHKGFGKLRAEAGARANQRADIDYDDAHERRVDAAMRAAGY